MCKKLTSHTTWFIQTGNRSWPVPVSETQQGEKIHTMKRAH